MAAAVRDIHQASDMSRDNLTAVAARSVPATTVTRSHPLPTPPNSISPALPPHGLKAQLQKAKLEPIDSDLDLHEDHVSRQASRSPSYDTTGNISTALLAKHHLPDILLNHGPLAIRHIMGYLTTSVPGFAGIPPTKARRLVVGALEGRGYEGAGVDGDVEFEKVGWGRWDARRRGQPARTASPPTDYRSGIPISTNAGRATDRSRLNVASSSNGDSIVFSHDDRDAMMMEDEADKMSLDGSASASCSEAPDDDDDMAMNDDPEDATDDEDWAAVGAAALRAESYNNTTAHSVGRSFLSTGVYTPSGLRSVSTGMARSHQPLPFDFSALGATSDAQEREAVEALLRLGSV
ncbi:Protein STB3 [Colletotrichum sidae]|uniref:Protein STB3 n=2 Tax=Colletotrichum orbiculare species complex TaxID=2707354 RepID=A0A4R8RM91_COLTR|nr:Protein STB3 [Colletotrichum trifolii]TEA15515.1 Protein STB3 [Colletotrichum sidae]